MSPCAPKPPNFNDVTYEDAGYETQCWLAPNAPGPKGYAFMRDGTGRRRYAHRLSYERFVGPIPEGYTVDHLCRNRRCVNPDHLEAVTNRENILRGESPPAKYARRTHCKNGHEYTPENTLLTSSRGRTCRTCRRIGGRKHYHKHLSAAARNQKGTGKDSG